MGGALNIEIYTGDVKGLPKWWKGRQEQDRYEHGHETYSGGIGTLEPGVQLIPNQTPFTTQGQAEDFIEESHYKGHKALAVPFKGTIEVPFIALKQALTRRDAAGDKVETLARQFLAEARATKSKTIGCKRCGSSITRSYLKLGRDTHGAMHMDADRIPCPVCGNDLMTPTAQKRLQAAADALQKAENECYDLRDRKETKPGINWAVGGWCRE